MNRSLKHRREATVDRDPLSDAEIRRTASTGTAEVDFVPLAESILAVTDWTPLDLACLLHDVAVCAREPNADADVEYSLTGLTVGQRVKVQRGEKVSGALFDARPEQRARGYRTAVVVPADTTGTVVSVTRRERRGNSTIMQFNVEYDGLGLVRHDGNYAVVSLCQEPEQVCASCATGSATQSANDFRLEHLQGNARQTAEIVVAWLTRHLERPPYGGGCRAFYTSEEWVNRGEEYGGNAMLVICHDGGDMSAASGVLADPEAAASLTDLLAQCGYRLARFGWYSGVYPL